MLCWLNTSSTNRPLSSLISSGVGMSHPLRPWHRAELLHQLRNLDLRPGLRDLPVGVMTGDLDPTEVDRRVVRRDPEPGQSALVRPRAADARDHHVALAEDV